MFNVIGQKENISPIIASTLQRTVSSIVPSISTGGNEPLADITQKVLPLSTTVQPELSRAPSRESIISELSEAPHYDYVDFKGEPIPTAPLTKSDYIMLQELDRELLKDNSILSVNNDVVNNLNLDDDRQYSPNPSVFKFADDVDKYPINDVNRFCVARDQFRSMNQHMKDYRKGLQNSQRRNVNRNLPGASYDSNDIEIPSHDTGSRPYLFTDWARDILDTLSEDYRKGEIDGVDHDVLQYLRRQNPENLKAIGVTFKPK